MKKFLALLVKYAPSIIGSIISKRQEKQEKEDVR